MLSRSKPLPYICARCSRQIRHVRTYTSSTASLEPPREYLPFGRSPLPHRRLLYIAGRDAPVFLHNLVTSNVIASSPHGTYTAFLNAPGRILYDAFIYPVAWSHTFHAWRDEKLGTTSGVTKGGDRLDWAAFIEVDAQVLPGLMQHIKRYKLRSKFAYREVDPGDWEIWSSWDAAEPGVDIPATSPGIEASAVANEGGGAAHTHIPSTPPPNLAPDAPITLHDPRPTLTTRLLHRTTTALPPPLTALPAATPAHYALHRYLHGLPEGAGEIAAGSALPHEHNLDLLGAVDFRKGCYVGQELTIRTQHTGVIRKRILPCALYEGSSVPETLRYEPSVKIPVPPGGADIKPVEGRGRSGGKWAVGMGNVGLGLCRLELMTDVRVTVEGPAGWKEGKEFGMIWEGDGGMERVKIKGFVPAWMRERLTVRKTQKRVE
ncbi:Aminomethyltransferase folate-binding domain-containing protein [Eremomyces bilateralis CBS 781.70]|uniref:Iron-sulfur cluster assembly factor IBA57 homolog, mitochondrial n=1 Tax=Eremomyces bilateralis CBS 781.70 TaxID=1392243 RepID=A0A6G1GA15_9PEZI|nr:Aminomethyltransferase folate-binding domain-containing protein [Eremomyces bilateralis CBS 781.70]KAF1814918.1 Aminomethyltransferase folate-binding domain-containing protein [Eremomyces bilateralis CBS 781.70]